LSRLDAAFFARSVHDVARDLVGCTLLHDGVGGTIVETESYHRDDPACHAYGGPTPRSSILWGPPGIAYVYFSYGIHSLLNAVAEPEGEAAAVLIRALEPTVGVEEMRERRGRDDVRDLCSGPGKLTQALGVELADNGRSLLEPPFEVRGPNGGSPPVEVVTAPRVGITKAADYPWRFCASGSTFVSRPQPKGV
jgi:DNA-3-methyladenine glycosylase